jgi:NAD(P)H dehydrogenase (quinone)
VSWPNSATLRREGRQQSDSPGLVQTTAQFAQAAEEVGVEVIVNMSQKPARSDAKSEASRQHWLSERVFDWSGVSAVHLRPTLFAEWLLYLAPMIRHGRMLAPFSATGRAAPVAAEDQARLIVAVLEHPTAHVGKTYPLFGPVELTHPEIAAIISHVIGKKVAYQQVPSSGLRLTCLIPDDILSDLVSTFLLVQNARPLSRYPATAEIVWR